MANKNIKIQLNRKTSKVGDYYSSAENIDLVKIGRELNCRKVRFYSYDLTKDIAELVIEPPKPEYADKVATPYAAKEGKGLSTGMWRNPTQKGSITATNGAIDLDAAVEMLGGLSSVSIAIFQNQNKTDADKKPHWNLKLSEFVPKARTQPAEGNSASSDRPM